MPNDNGRPRKISQANKEEAFIPIRNAEPLEPDEFTPFQPHPDFWGVHAERFRKGLTKNPIVVENPKNEINLSKLMQESPHYFELESVEKRSIVCTSCAVKHGGILEARHLTRYKLEEGVLYFNGKPINRTS